VTAQKTVVVVNAMTQPLRRAAQNVPWLTVVTPPHVSVYQLMQARHVVFERAALAALEEALAR
jgi:ribosomal protein L4